LEGLPVFADVEGPFGSTTSDSARTRLSDSASRLFMVLIRFGDPSDLESVVAGTCADLAEHCAARDIEPTVL